MFDASHQPAYCCAILRDLGGRYLLERRPAGARSAGGKLTCFGGAREEGEEPEACIRRELREELGYETEDLERCVRLVSGREVAWFYRGPAPNDLAQCVLEPGVEAVWLGVEELEGALLADWHRAAIACERAGETVARVTE